MSIELKIKAVTLAAEARIIRNHEHRLARKLAKARARIAANPGDNEGTLKLNLSRGEDSLFSIHGHRVHVVREEARLTHLARAFLRGTPYKTVENKTLPTKALKEDHLERIARMATSYGGRGRVYETLIESWIEPNTDGKTNWAEATS